MVKRYAEPLLLSFSFPISRRRFPKAIGFHLTRDRVASLNASELVSELRTPDLEHDFEADLAVLETDLLNWQFLFFTNRAGKFVAFLLTLM